MKCPQCGAVSPGGKKFCGDCGASLSENAVPREPLHDPWPTLPQTAPHEPERRPLTVVFCDLIGSTALGARLDAEDFRDIIAAYHARVAETVTRHGGFVAKFMGDGVLVYFGYPLAREDDAARAVAAALALVEAVRTLRPSVIAEPLRIRAGIASGEAIVDLIGTGAAQEHAVVGAAPNLAARLQELAEPESVVISADIKRLTGGLFEYRDLGTITVKGFPEPIKAWQVMGASAVESRFEALRHHARIPLLGREADLHVLLECWAAAKTGRGRVVLLSGEPGIGKSSIAADLLTRLSGQAFTPLRFFCSSNHVDSALHPLLARIERIADLKRDDSPDRKLEKLATMLASTSGKPDDFPLLADLLSIPKGRFPALKMNAEEKKEKTLASLVGHVVALSRHQPVFMLCEDVQWMDPTSLELLNRLVNRAGEIPVMVLLTFRP
jgi:class 3 adenylate cyclase